MDANANDKFFFDKFYLPVWKDKIASFSFVKEKLAICWHASSFLNKSIGELSEQASKREPTTEVANNNTRVNAACSAVPDQVSLTVD